MSSGIMEKNLPVATELGEGDMVRIVTGGGNSKQIDASAIGGGGCGCCNIVISQTVEEIPTKASSTTYLHTLNVTYKDIIDVVLNGCRVVLVGEYEEQGGKSINLLDLYADGFAPYQVIDASQAGEPVGYYVPSPFNEGQSFYSETIDGEMTYTFTE